LLIDLQRLQLLRLRRLGHLLGVHPGIGVARILYIRRDGYRG
jgi:hypothetical protein